MRNATYLSRQVFLYLTLSAAAVAWSVAAECQARNLLQLVAQSPITPSSGLGGTPEPGEIFHDCPDCPEMVVVPAGDFKMGSSATPYEKPEHQSSLPVRLRSDVEKSPSRSGTSALQREDAITGP